MRIHSIAVILAALTAMASPAFSQIPPQVEACRKSGLAALQQRSPSLDEIVLDMDSLAISKADTKVGDTSIKMVIMGEAYLQRDKTDKPNRFLCLLSDEDEVVLTFFTAQ
jgi:hypothetical protein